jgi:CcmD family protein
MIRRITAAIICFALTATTTFAFQAADSQDGFRPLSELPPGQQLPAAPFLVGAYAFIWIALMVYLWSIMRRLNKVEREMRVLEQRSQKSGSR